MIEKNCFHPWLPADRFVCRAHLPAYVALLAVLWATPSLGIDRLYEKSGENISGEVTKTSAQAVQIQRGSTPQTVPAGQIEKILYEGDPPALTRGREFALDGQYEQALTELNKIDFEELPREVIKADAAFFLAFTEAKLALAGKSKKDEAAKKMLGFAGNYRNSWHFFEAAKLLGDLALAQNDTTNALKYYKSLMSAPTTESKIESVYLQGLVHLKNDDPAAAQTEFEKVIGVQAQTTETARLQTLAKAGKAVALASSGNPEEGLKLVETLIAELNPADVEMAARIYNAQGAAFQATGDTEGAILAYLHTHLMFSAQPDAHAEALKQLVSLWPEAGKPERAAQARQELQQRYPGF